MSNVVDLALQNFIPRNPMGNSVVVIVEVSYLEVRDPEAADRLNHTKDAQDLVQRLIQKYPNLAERILLTSFINDFDPPGACNEYCPSDAAEKLQAKSGRLLARELANRTSTRVAGLDKTFFMKQTRAHVIERIRTALANEPELVWQEDDLLYAETYEGPRRIAKYKAADRISVPCASLMGQHYFDLLMYAKERADEIEEFWIFDFNRFTEQQQVKYGADVGFALFEELRNANVRIVNLVYRPNSNNIVQVRTSDEV